MKDKMLIISEPFRAKTMDWLYPETQDDDFLSGKTPSKIEYAWDDEE